MANIKTKIATVFLGLSAVAIVSGCGQPAEPAQQQAKVRPVKLIEVAQRNTAQVQTFPAVIDAVQTSRLAFQVNGQIQELNVIAAQQVQQGDVIAKLDQRDFVTNLNSAKAQFDASQSEYQRAIKLVEDGVVSSSEFEQIESKRDIAKASFDSAEKALADSVLTAPYDAYVLDVPVKELDNVTVGMPVVGLMGLGQMEAIVNIPASIVATVSEDYQPSAKVRLEAIPGSPIHATFRRANLEADPATQTYQVRFAFNPPLGINVLPGMNATLEVDFTLGNEDSLAVTVPNQAHRGPSW